MIKVLNKEGLIRRGIQNQSDLNWLVTELIGVCLSENITYISHTFTACLGMFLKSLKALFKILKSTFVQGST
jgi:hypothetical protein